MFDYLKNSKRINVSGSSLKMSYTIEKHLFVLQTLTNRLNNYFNKKFLDHLPFTDMNYILYIKIERAFRCYLKVYNLDFIRVKIRWLLIEI